MRHTPGVTDGPALAAGMDPAGGEVLVGQLRVGEERAGVALDGAAGVGERVPVSGMIQSVAGQFVQRPVAEQTGFGEDDLLLVCYGPKGGTTAQYDFYLPQNLYGKPTMHVYGDKLCCASSVVKKTLVRVKGLHYRIVIKVSRTTRYDVRSVSLSYYVK